MKKRSLCVKKRSRKAQANTLVVILIILIILVAMVIIWNVVLLLVRERSEEVAGGAAVLSINLEIQDIVLFVTGSSAVTVHRLTGGGEVNSLEFVFYNENGQVRTETKEGSIGQLETEVYYFSPFSGFGEIIGVSVVPVVGKSLGREFSAKADKILDLPEGLVSWWRFNNEEDFVGENNGVVFGGAQINEGDLILDGVGYFEVSNSSDLELYNSFAISAWINFNEPFVPGLIIKKGNNYGIGLNSNKEIEFSTENLDMVSLDSVDNGWNHILINSVGGNIRIYLNNEAVGQGVFDFNENIENLLIGQGFNGKIDEIMVFDKSLAINQIDSLYSLLRKG